MTVAFSDLTFRFYATIKGLTENYGFAGAAEIFNSRVRWDRQLLREQEPCYPPVAVAASRGPHAHHAAWMSRTLMIIARGLIILRRKLDWV